MLGSARKKFELRLVSDLQFRLGALNGDDRGGGECFTTKRWDRRICKVVSLRNMGSNPADAPPSAGWREEVSPGRARSKSSECIQERRKA